jgi:hypothetical protein
MDRAAIVHAYTRAGCKVHPGDDVDETGAPIVRADCGDGWGAARHLVAQPSEAWRHTCARVPQAPRPTRAACSPWCPV